MKRILFQGDSITDAGRLKTENEDGVNLGFGYPAYAASQLGVEYPGEFEFVNKGISGNRITDLYARIKKDIINIKPDYLSIMIGVNDVWHGTINEGVSDERYEALYNWLIEDIITDNSKIKIIIMSPYCDELTKGISATFNDEVFNKAKIAKKTAEKYNLTFMDTQAVIDKAVQKAPIKYWTTDGVHPTIYGHRIIADEWVKVFKSMYER